MANFERHLTKSGEVSGIQIMIALLYELFGMVTRHKMPGGNFPIFRIDPKTFFSGYRATGIKVATSGRIYRAGDISFEENAMTVPGFIRIRDGNS